MKPNTVLKHTQNIIRNTKKIKNKRPRNNGLNWVSNFDLIIQATKQKEEDDDILSFLFLGLLNPFQQASTIS